MGACARKEKRAGKSESSGRSKADGHYAQDVVGRNTVPLQLASLGRSLKILLLSYPDVVRIIPNSAYAEFDCANHKGRFNDT